MIRFHLLTENKWISNRQNNGDFDYYFVIELLDWVETVGPSEAPEADYNVTLSVVSPQEAAGSLQAAYDCCGIDDEMLANVGTNLADVQVEALYTYSGGVPVWGMDGNNARKLMAMAREEALKCSTLFGFYMDRHVNRMGTTGWEALRLTDPRETLKRCVEEQAARCVEEQATGCTGAGDYARWAKSQGFDYCEVIDWTSSAGDWSFMVSRDGEEWFPMFQENNYPRGPGFTRTISDVPIGLKGPAGAVLLYVSECLELEIQPY